MWAAHHRTTRGRSGRALASRREPSSAVCVRSNDAVKHSSVPPGAYCIVHSRMHSA
jgi:hypothetical protein